jgi:hypothetical protein
MHGWAMNNIILEKECTSGQEVTVARSLGGFINQWLRFKNQ